MEIADDMALGVMLKRAGARQRVLVAQDAVSLQFYPSYGAMARALEKNGAQAPLPQLLVGLSALLTLEWGWLAGFATTAWPSALGVGALSVLTSVMVARWLRNPLGPALFSGVGTALLAGVMVRSAVLAWRRGGVVWRDTFYKTAAVRAGKRLLLSGAPSNRGDEALRCSRTYELLRWAALEWAPSLMRRLVRQH